MVKELYVAQFMGFGLTVDLKDSNSYMLYFSVFSPTLPKDTYQNGTDQQINAYLEYIKTMLALGGETEENAALLARQYFEMEKLLSESMMNTADSNNVDKIYNAFTMEQIQELFPHVDMDAVFADSGLQMEDQIIIMDTGLTEAFAAYFNDEHLDA